MFNKLSNPSLKPEAPSLLTDEMLIAFCDSQLEVIAEERNEIKTAITEENESLFKLIEQFSKQELPPSGGKINLHQIGKVYFVPFHYEKMRYADPEFVFELARRTNPEPLRVRIEIPFKGANTVPKDTFVGWLDSIHHLDFDNFIIDIHRPKPTISEFNQAVFLRDWILENTAYFDGVIRFLEKQYPDFQSFIERAFRGLRHLDRQEKQLILRKALAQKRIQQARALHIIEHGYHGEPIEMFRKLNRPIIVTDIEVLHIYPSKRVLKVRFKGRDFKKYTYDHYNRYRTGTVYKNTAVWVQDNVHVKTLFGVDINTDYSEEGAYARLRQEI